MPSWSPTRRIRQSAVLNSRALKILRLQSSMLRDSAKSASAEFHPIVPRPCVVGIIVVLESLMRTRFALYAPAHTEKCSQHPGSLRAWPAAHEKWMDFGGFLIC